MKPYPFCKSVNHQDKTLTDRQSEVLEFCRSFFRENDQLPPMLTIAAEFQFCNNAAQDHVKALVKKGYLEKNSVGKYRFSRG